MYRIYGKITQDPHFIDQLFEFNNKYLDIIQKHCNNNTVFKYVLREAFEIFLNLPIGDYGVAEYLAIYGDKLLSKDQKISNETELQYKLDKLVTSFSYLSDKDLFITVYQNQLSKRLLLDKSQNIEDEKHVMNKIKQTYVSSFIFQLRQCDHQALGGYDRGLSVIIRASTVLPQCISIKFLIISYDFLDLMSSVRILSLSDWPIYKEFNQINIHPEFPVM